MSTSQFGLTSSSIIPQADFKATLDEFNVWSGSQSFKILATSWDTLRTSFRKGVYMHTLWAAWTTAPVYFKYLKVISSNPTITKGGIMDVEVKCGGTGFGTYGLEPITSLDADDPDYPIVEIDPDTGEPTAESVANANSFSTDPNTGSQVIPTYNMEGAVSEAQITQHPLVVALSETDKKKIAMLLRGDIYYDATNDVYRQETTLAPFGDAVTFSSGNAATFAGLIVKGVTSYIRPTIVWREMRQGNTPLTSSQISALGQVVKNPPGNPPTALGRDYMLTGATQERQGDVYRCSREWTLSEAGGWDTDLYEA